MVDLEPIGTVSTPFDTPDEAPRQGENTNDTGSIHLDPPYGEGLDGIEAGDDIIVVWFADEADRTLLEVDRRGGMGVFNSRSPARPNPICLTTCKVTDVGQHRLGVAGVDMVDGSPVLDLKPPLQ